MTGNQPDKIDELLDQALAGYISAEPQPGLEKRVLAHIQNQPRSSWAKPAFSVLALASLAAALIIFWPSRSRPAIPTRPEPKLPQLASNLQLRRQLILPVSRPARHTRRSNSSAAPKLAVFPAPQPLTSEELALVTFARKPMKEVPPELLGPRKIEPIQIEPFEIKPLPSAAAKEN
jgi:hypothetical protein